MWGGFIITTRHEIQLNLLNEIDEICSKHNLHYFLIGSNALSAYNDHTIDNGFRMVAVAMPSEDIVIFSKIVKKDFKDRYIEVSSQKQDPLYFVSYGDKNTTFFSLRDLDFHKQHGIIIRIYPIRKSVAKNEVEVVQTTGILSDIKKEFKKFIKKSSINKDSFFVKYGIGFLRYLANLYRNANRYFKSKHYKAIIKESLFNIFGRNSWFTESLIDIYKHIYSTIKVTYFFFKNLRKHPFIEEWSDLRNHEKIKIINQEVKSESLREIDKIDVDGIDLNLPSEEFFIEVFGENFEKKTVSSKPIRATAILDTETGYQDIIKDRKKHFSEIKAIQREIRKTRSEVMEETIAVNKIFKLVKMTDLQIKYQNFFERNREELFSYDMENEEEFTQLNNRLSPIIKNLRKHAEIGMTFSIDEEADLLIKEVMLRNGEEELVDRIEELSKLEYFVE